MARHRKPRRTGPPPIPLDYGPAIRLGRGDVVVADRPDPDNPNRTVRVGRAVEPIDRIRGLSDRAGQAGRKYRDAWMLVHIGLTPANDGVGGSVHPAHRTPHSESVAHANARLVRAAILLGLHGVAAVNLCLIAGEPLNAAYGRLWPAAPVVHHKTAEQRVLAALTVHLERLADEWNI